jgi:hypothetical protein
LGICQQHNHVLSWLIRQPLTNRQKPLQNYGFDLRKPSIAPNQKQIGCDFDFVRHLTVIGASQTAKKTGEVRSPETFAAKASTSEAANFSISLLLLNIIPELHKFAVFQLQPHGQPFY